MADLDSFFKKKDKRKKKAQGAPVGATAASTTAATGTAAPAAAATSATAATAATAAVPAVVVGDKVGAAADGDWIELEDAKAVVNTGGRTVKELNRGELTELERLRNAAPQVDAFSGWNSEKRAAATAEAAAAAEEAAAAAAATASAAAAATPYRVGGGGATGRRDGAKLNAAAFPSLSDAVVAPKNARTVAALPGVGAGGVPLKRSGPGVPGVGGATRVPLKLVPRSAPAPSEGQ